jgi:hypothetical protein
MLQLNFGLTRNTMKNRLEIIILSVAGMSGRDYRFT